jgi:hypothetical protein
MKNTSIIALCLLVLSPSVFAQWNLVSEDSNINFISTKKASIAEVHRFKELSGMISDKGVVDIKIDLGSVQTNIDIRNERMKTMFFETTKFAQATVVGIVNITKVAALEVGDTYTETVNIELSLHGISQAISKEVQVTKLTNDKLRVTSLAPIVMNVEDYGLSAGVENLRQAASLSSISTAIPVTFNFVFIQ